MRFWANPTSQLREAAHRVAVLRRVGGSLPTGRLSRPLADPPPGHRSSISTATHAPQRVHPTQPGASFRCCNRPQRRRGLHQPGGQCGSRAGCIYWTLIFIVLQAQKLLLPSCAAQALVKNDAGILYKHAVRTLLQRHLYLCHCNLRCNWATLTFTRGPLTQRSTCLSLLHTRYDAAHLLGCRACEPGCLTLSCQRSLTSRTMLIVWSVSEWGGCCHRQGAQHLSSEHTTIRFP